MGKKHRNRDQAAVNPIAGSDEPTGEEVLETLDGNETSGDVTEPGETAEAEEAKPVEAEPAPAAEAAPAPEPQVAPQEPPKVPMAAPAPVKVKEKVMSAELLKPKVGAGNVFAARRAANAVSGNHTATGRKVLDLLAKYQARMSVPSDSREENIMRIKMLQQVLNTACPQANLDLQTATDIARIVFDHMMTNWGTVYNDTNIFRMGDTLKGTAYDMDKLVLFFEAFVQMVEGVQDKKRVLFDDGRLSKVLKNPNMVIAMGRIRDSINARNFGTK